MDDLQLLELLEKAQKKQRGPQGATGVGIDSIDQFDGESFTVKLTTGESKKISLPIPANGETGPQGVKGEKGDVGAEGKPGKSGADALPGAPGRDGSPGASVDTAVVNSNGHLLLGITDGTVIDVGRVIGPAGATGASGPTGLAGSAGVDGLSVLSGPRAPQSDDGKEGDHWIDISSAEFGFYKKSGDSWSKLANLRQPAKDTRVGAGAGAGGAGGGSGGDGTLQDTSTLPLSGKGTRATVNAPGGNIVKEKKGLKNQAGLNNWVQAGLMAIDKAVPVAVVDVLPATGQYEGELIFADGVLNIWADGAWVEIVGDQTPTKEMLPWVQISQFKMEERDPTAWGAGYCYSSWWSSNPSATTTWQWEIDVNADGNWVDVANHPQKDALGFEPDSEMSSSLVMVVKNQKADFANALFRYRVTGSLNGYDSEAISDEVPAWDDFAYIYRPEEPPHYDDGAGNKQDPKAYEDAWIKERFATNTEQIQFLDTGVRDNSVAIKKGLVDQAAMNADLKTETEARKVADSDLQAQIDSIESEAGVDPDTFTADQKRQDDALSAERVARAEQILAVNDELKAEISARTVADSNFQAQIDELEEGATYDDSQLWADQVRQDNDLGAERATRIQNEVKLATDIEQESEARQRADIDLLEKIDALEIPANADEIIARIDNDIQVTNEKIDFNAEETLKDQERQDKDQERQDEEIQKGIEEQNKIKLAIEELQVTKGSVARYQITATSIGAASRDGELYVMSPIAADVQAMSFAPFDLGGEAIRPCDAGNIVEFVEPVSGEVNRYRVLSGDYNALTVEYLNGAHTFVVNETLEVYIYPQNGVGVSKDYVDNNFLALAGGTLTSTLGFNRGNKSFVQFGIEPNSGTSDTNLFVYNNGQLRFRSSHTGSNSDRVGSHIVLDPNNGAPETKIYHIVTPTDDHMAANKEYADEKIAKEGDNTLKDSTNWKVKQKNSSGTVKTLMQAQGGQLGLYNVKEPTESHHVATKKYVDDNAGGGGGSSPTGDFKIILDNDNYYIVPA